MDVMELLKWIPDDDKDRYLDYETTFGTPGWKHIVEWAAFQGENALIRAGTAESWEANRVAYGQGLVYNEVMNMAERILNEYENMAEQAKNDSEVDNELDFE